MPQMSPMLWSLLFIYFLLIFMTFNILNYFYFIPMLKNSIQPEKNSNLFDKNTLNWKW